MFGKVVRFDDEGRQVITQPPEAQAVGAGSDNSSLARQHRDTADLEWMQRLLDSQSAMVEFAQRERALATAELIRVAQVLCKEAWDAKSRSGNNPETWSPKMLADLIISSVSGALRANRLFQDPDLPEKYHQVAGELAQVRAENDSLRQRVRAAEEAARDMIAVAAKEGARRQKPVERRMAAPPTASESQPDSQQPDRPHQVQADVAGPALASTVIVDGVSISVDPTPDAQNVIIPEATPAQIGSNNERVDDVIRVIAEHGLCRWKDISQQLANLWGKRLTSGAMDNAISKSISFGLLRAEEVPLEWGGKPTGKMLALTDKGMACALSLGVKSVESQYRRGIAVHKDGAHFYVILEVAGILAIRYATVDYFPPLILVEGEKYYPDITAIESSGNKISVEVERGTYKAQREGKWLRAAAANGGTIYLVTPNQEVMVTIVAEINLVRERYFDRIRRILAFNVRSYRENRGDGSASLWAYEG
jgi:hypothetical protein